MDNKELNALIALRDMLVNQGRHKDALEINKRIDDHNHPKCKVYYVDFKAKRLLKVA